jgi:hypothetical protein
MTTHRTFLVAVGAILLMTVGVAFAATQERFKFYGNTAFAIFEGESDDSCVFTNALVLGSDSIQKVPGDPDSAFRGTFATYSEFNECTGDSIVGTGSGGPEAFTIKKLSSASVTVSLEMTHFDFDPVSGTTTETPLGTATMTVQWTGVGDINKTKTVTRTTVIVGPGGFVRISLKGNALNPRDTTVQGTLLLDGQDLLAGLIADSHLLESTIGEHIVVKKH